MALRFKLDENITLDATTLPGEAGHEVQTVFQERLGGRANPQVLNACRGEARILVTFDVDFADVRAYPPASHAGIRVLRPATQSIENTLTLLRSALALPALEIEAACRRRLVNPDFAGLPARRNLPRLANEALRCCDVGRATGGCR